MARLTDLRQRLHTISEFVCRDEERRLMTIRIQSISVHYDLSIPPEFREATERALRVHTEGCPAHQSVKDAIKVTWEATLRSGDEVISLKSEEEGE